MNLLARVSPKSGKIGRRSTIFAQLSGIVFGMRTPLSEKLRAINIIKKKCDAVGRTDFQIYNIVYHPIGGKLVRL